MVRESRQIIMISAENGALKNGKVEVLVRSVTPKKGYLVVARYLGK